MGLKDPMIDQKKTLYVGCALSGELYTVTLSLATGTLEYVSHMRLPGLAKPGGAMPLALSRARNTLYAVSRGEPFFIASFTIDPKGGLQHLGNTPVESNLAYIQTSADDTHLLSASFIDHHVSIFGIQKDRRVADQAHRIREILNAHMLSMAPDDKTILATGLGKDVIYQWQWESLVEGGGSSFSVQQVDELTLSAGTGPRHIAYHPAQPIAYIIGERNGAVSVVRYDTAGLSHLQTAHLPDQQEAFQAADIHISPDGRFLYASEKATSTLHLFNVQPDGTLIFEKHFETENRPRGFALSACGHYLIAAGQFSHHIASYRIDENTGYLALTDRLPVGQSPDWIEIR
ncbi:lactonase family protein [Vreelandella songnenensis]|nr:beta-propeller fold lactonase family protein [Halomonas songnenensis]